MRRPIGKRIEQVCAACEQESTFSEIAFLMGLADKTGNVNQHIQKAVAFGFIEKTGNTYKAQPDWKWRIKVQNGRPQRKESEDYVMVSRCARLQMGRVNSVFQLGAQC